MSWRVMSTHLDLRSRHRRRQFATLLDQLVPSPRQPTVLMGDFNEWMPGSPTLRPFLRQAADTRPPASFPSWLPVLALDRVLAYWVGAPLHCRRYGSALARRASDHLPVVMEIGPAAGLSAGIA